MDLRSAGYASRLCSARKQICFAPLRPCYRLCTWSSPLVLAVPAGHRWRLPSAPYLSHAAGWAVASRTAITKRAINIGLKQLADSIMDASLGLEADSNITEDRLEGIKAFLERMETGIRRAQM